MKLTCLGNSNPGTVVGARMSVAHTAWDCSGPTHQPSLSPVRAGTRLRSAPTPPPACTRRPRALAARPPPPMASPGPSPSLDTWWHPHNWTPIHWPSHDIKSARCHQPWVSPSTPQSSSNRIAQCPPFPPYLVSKSAARGPSPSPYSKPLPPIPTVSSELPPLATFGLHPQCLTLHPLLLMVQDLDADRRPPLADQEHRCTPPLKLPSLITDAMPSR
jgi:hypothetical protein